MSQGDFVYFFFRETAVEYINCGKVRNRRRLIVAHHPPYVDFERNRARVIIGSLRTADILRVSRPTRTSALLVPMIKVDRAIRGGGELVSPLRFHFDGSKFAFAARIFFNDEYITVFFPSVVSY